MDAVVRGQTNGTVVPLSYAGQMFVVAAAYFAAGQLALWAGMTPGRAGVIWPAAGIGLACVLLLGYRVWPGVCLGAALVEVLLDSQPVVVALMGAAGVLEALAAAALVRRFIGMPVSFERGEDAVEFVAITGLAALIGAVAAATAGWAQSLAPQAVAWTRWQADA